MKNNIITLQGFIEGIPVHHLLLLLNKLKKTGILKFIHGEISKSLFFKNGNVVFATSNLDEDRLGESLVRNGKITKEQLELCAKEISPVKKLGKILVDKGFITAKDLFLGVRKQIEEIVISLFQFESGYFEFKEESFSEIAANIPINLKNTVLQGMRKFVRNDKVENSLISSNIHLSVREDPDIEFSQEEKEVINLVKSKGIAGDIIALNNMKITGTLHRLLELEIVFPAGKFFDEKEISFDTKELLQNINSVLMDIFTIIKSKAPSMDVYRTLNTFFTNLSPEFKDIYHGIQLRKDGSIDVERLIQNCSKLKDRGKDFIHRAIGELLQFELFELRHYLKREEEQELLELLKEFKFER